MLEQHTSLCLREFGRVNEGTVHGGYLEARRTEELLGIRAHYFTLVCVVLYMFHQQYLIYVAYLLC